MTHIHYHKMAFAATWIACVALGSTARADDAAGVVRISDRSEKSHVVIRANDDSIGDVNSTSISESTITDCSDSNVASGNCAGHSRMSQWWDDQLSLHYSRRLTNEEGIEYARYRRQCWWANQNAAYRNRNMFLNCQIRDHMRCKFGYFIPTGCCGSGCPIAGRYRMVYAVDPNYADPRDGGVFSAQGSGTPMAVPLAPNVGHTYNYSWGLPSSRLTPISHMGPIPSH
ncbi:MAG: hypothetical protein O2955_12850 [Planctomycetota bacterium]|nr:hypothetical protein [Planctomycetota bacterium]MDA1213397.1 hypothetical protein [Planctomycetota bacterium]